MMWRRVTRSTSRRQPSTSSRDPRNRRARGGLAAEPVADVSEPTRASSARCGGVAAAAAKRPSTVSSSASSSPSSRAPGRKPARARRRAPAGHRRHRRCYRRQRTRRTRLSMVETEPGRYRLACRVDRHRQTHVQGTRTLPPIVPQRAVRDRATKPPPPPELIQDRSVGKICKGRRSRSRRRPGEGFDAEGRG